MWKKLSRVNPFSPDIYLCGVCLAFTSSPWNTFMRRSGCVTLHSFWEKKSCWYSHTHTHMHTKNTLLLAKRQTVPSFMLDRLEGAWDEKCQPVPTHSTSVQYLLAPCRPAQNLSVTLSSPAILKCFYWCLDLDITLDIKLWHNTVRKLFVTVK